MTNNTTIEDDLSPYNVDFEDNYGLFSNEDESFEINGESDILFE